MEADKNNKTVFVGLSGGVDSSVAALRLKKDGYNVVGVFIKVWQPDFLKCNWEEERLDAMRVAAHLDIPFLTCDAEEIYRKEVGEYFIREYERGHTPNPDVMCNKYVKFGAFLRFALQHGADYVATGHYARIEKNGNEYCLLRGTDEGKDQSYFLWTLTKKELAKILFPVGNSKKAEIREEAKEAGLPTAVKKDSQGICFLGHVDIPDFLAHFIKLEPGKVLDERGKEIGSHKGALVYTLGQRHGFTVKNEEALQKPVFVISRDLVGNTITVAKEPTLLKDSTEILLTDVNWMSEPKGEQELVVQFRYRQTPIPVKISHSAETQAALQLKDYAQKPSVGQSAVIYRGEECLGGGIISL